MNRGYDEDEVQTQIDKATKSDREMLLQPKQNKTPLDRIPLVVTYHPGLPPLKNILEKHLPILRVSNRLSTAVKNLPLVAYRRPPNLKSLLVRAAFRKPLSSYRGNSRCGQSRCKTCQHIKTVDKFKSSSPGRNIGLKLRRTVKHRMSSM